MRVLVGCEFSGLVRDAFRALGHDAWSCDLLPTDRPGPHIVGDVLDAIRGDHWDLGIFFPPCTYLTVSAEWAYPDPDYIRFPGKGYHQRIKPGTLFGAARREAREQAVEFSRKLMECDIERTVLENPVGRLSTRIRPYDQLIHPYHFGHDASKRTCLWLKGVGLLRPTLRIAPRLVERDGKVYQRWANQTDSGQNRETPDDDRWAVRSETYAGVAWAMANQWGRS